MAAVLGQQLMLLTELMVLAVPAFFTDSSAIFDPSGKRKRMGATRSELNLHAAHFVKSQAKTDAAAVRNIAVSYARKARVCDVVYHSDDTALFVDVAGLQLPAEHDVKTIFMLRWAKLRWHADVDNDKLTHHKFVCCICREPTMTPTVDLLSLTTVIMQTQMAGLLGRVPCATSALVNITWSEMELFRAFTDRPEVDTPCVSISELASGVTASEAGTAPVIVAFVNAAATRGDTLLPYYSLQRLARELFKAGEELTAATLNGCTSRFRTLLNAFRAQQFPATEPLFRVLDRLHKPYQVRIASLIAWTSGFSSFWASFKGWWYKKKLNVSEAVCLFVVVVLKTM
jgi:hypothetical protein